jgi:hypothetical protein
MQNAVALYLQGVPAARIKNACTLPRKHAYRLPVGNAPCVRLSLRTIAIAKHLWKRPATRLDSLMRVLWVTEVVAITM